MYSFGKNVKIHLYGKGHGNSVGCILEGIPKGLAISIDELNFDMDLRRPRHLIGTERKEQDQVDLLYGIHDDMTTGSPILIDIPNTDIRSSDYDPLPRPGHADMPAVFKFKDHDTKGGGQFSGRLTAPIVAAGSIAKQFLSSHGIRIGGFAHSIGTVCDAITHNIDDAFASRSYGTRACSKELDESMTEHIVNVANDGDSVGGVAECIIDGLEMGQGGIWFDSLDSELSGAMFGIPGVKGIEFGDGFSLSRTKGSQSNDAFAVKNGRIVTSTNRMGGILGGMSTGMPLVFRVAFKPTPSIAVEQQTVDPRTMENVKIKTKGRHDPCIVPRGVSVIEAMAALVIADQVMTWKN